MFRTNFIKVLGTYFIFATSLIALNAHAAEFGYVACVYGQGSSQTWDLEDWGYATHIFGPEETSRIRNSDYPPQQGSCAEITDIVKGVGIVAAARSFQFQGNSTIQSCGSIEKDGGKLVQSFSQTLKPGEHLMAKISGMASSIYITTESERQQIIEKKYNFDELTHLIEGICNRVSHE
jgi:hypothetical protein